MPRSRSTAPTISPIAGRRTARTSTPRGRGGPLGLDEHGHDRLHDWAWNGDQLAELANRVLGNYQARGRSSARTPGRARGTRKPSTSRPPSSRTRFLEAAFARMLLAEKPEVVIVYSRALWRRGRRPDERLARQERRAGGEGAHGLEGPAAARGANELPQASAGSPSACAPTPGAARSGLSRQQAIAQLEARGCRTPGMRTSSWARRFVGRSELVRLFLVAGMGIDHAQPRGRSGAPGGSPRGLHRSGADLVKAGADPKLGNQVGLTPLIELSAYCDETAFFATLIRRAWT